MKSRICVCTVHYRNRPTHSRYLVHWQALRHCLREGLFCLWSSWCFSHALRSQWLWLWSYSSWNLCRLQRNHGYCWEYTIVAFCCVQWRQMNLQAMLWPGALWLYLVDWLSPLEGWQARVVRLCQRDTKFLSGLRTGPGSIAANIVSNGCLKQHRFLWGSI